MAEDANMPLSQADAGALRRAQHDVRERTKATERTLKELHGAVDGLQQASLFAEYPFEAELLLPAAELRKRYTGEQATKMDWRRNACIRMLAYRIPAEDIAADLHMNLRTIAALAQQNGAMLSGFSEKYANELMASAAADIALADTKKQDASYKDLHIGAGIKMQHAMAVKLVADTGAPAVDVEAESERLKALREHLKKLKAPGEQPKPADQPKETQ
ncbi:MAG: hypothetical protein KGL39_39640 [Patescibacteria group bacterium]|nr:hypothetical protein [Patescibacteria group bacterium]